MTSDMRSKRAAGEAREFIKEWIETNIINYDKLKRLATNPSVLPMLIEWASKLQRPSNTTALRTIYRAMRNPKVDRDIPDDTYIQLQRCLHLVDPYFARELIDDDLAWRRMPHMGSYLAMVDDSIIDYMFTKPAFYNDTSKGSGLFDLAETAPPHAIDKIISAPESYELSSHPLYGRPIDHLSPGDLTDKQMVDLYNNAKKHGVVPGQLPPHMKSELIREIHGLPDDDDDYLLSKLEEISR